MKRHAWRQCTKDASHVMCTPLYARLVRPVKVLELRLADWHPAVGEECLNAAQTAEAPPRRAIVDRRPPATLAIDVWHRGLYMHGARYHYNTMAHH
jgi:hypothetical protein